MTDFQQQLWDELEGRWKFLDAIPVAFSVSDIAGNAGMEVDIAVQTPFPESEHMAFHFECLEVPDCVRAYSLGSNMTLAQMLAPVIPCVMVVWNEREEISGF